MENLVLTIYFFPVTSWSYSGVTIKKYNGSSNDVLFNKVDEVLSSVHD